jgi:hypothetical protein
MGPALDDLGKGLDPTNEYTIRERTLLILSKRNEMQME